MKFKKKLLLQNNNLNERNCTEEEESDCGIYYFKKIINANVKIISIPFNIFNNDDFLYIKEYYDHNISKVYNCIACSSYDRSYIINDKNIGNITEMPFSCMFYMTKRNIYNNLLTISHIPSDMIYKSLSFFSNIAIYSLRNIIYIPQRSHFTGFVYRDIPTFFNKMKDKGEYIKYIPSNNETNEGFFIGSFNLEYIFKYLKNIKYLVDKEKKSITTAIYNRYNFYYCFIYFIDCLYDSGKFYGMKFDLSNVSKIGFTVEDILKVGNIKIELNEYDKFGFNPNVKLTKSKSSFNGNDISIYITQRILANGVDNTLKEIKNDKNLSLNIRKSIADTFNDQSELLPKNINHTSTNKRYLKSEDTETYSIGTMSKDVVIDNKLLISSSEMADIQKHLIKSIMKYLDFYNYIDINEITKVYDVIYDNKIGIVDLLINTRIIAKIFSSKKSAETEFSTGLIINEMRNIIPNFMYTYDLISCLVKNGFCIKNNKNENVLLLEYINGLKLEEIVKSDKIYDSYEIYSIICQIIISIIISTDHLGFNHGDLYSKNVMVMDIGHPIILKYILYGKEYKFNTSKLAILIDYGHSIFSKESEYENNKNRDFVIKQTSERMFEDISFFYPYRDLYSLIMSISGTNIDPFIYEKFLDMTFSGIDIIKNATGIDPNDLHYSIVLYIEEHCKEILSPQMEYDYRYINSKKLVESNGIIKGNKYTFTFPNIYTYLNSLYDDYILKNYIIINDPEDIFVFTYPTLE